MKLNEYGVTKLNEQNILAKMQKKMLLVFISPANRRHRAEVR